MSNDIDLEKLFKDNVKLVGFVITKYFRRIIENGIREREDLLQEGYIGLWRACKRFDPDRGVEFSTFAVSHIRGSIQRNLRDNNFVKTSRTIQNNRIKINKFKDRYTKYNGHTPSNEEIIEALGIKEKDIVDADRSFSKYFISLDKEKLNKEDSKEITSHEICRDDNDFYGVSEINILKKNILTKKENKIMDLLIAGYKQNEIAKIMNTSQVQISRINTKAKNKLKKAIKRKVLKSSCI